MSSTDLLPFGWRQSLRRRIADVELALVRASRPDDRRLVVAVELLRENLRVPDPPLTDAQVQALVRDRRRAERAPPWRSCGRLAPETVRALLPAPKKAEPSRSKARPATRAAADDVDEVELERQRDLEAAARADADEDEDGEL